MSRGSYAKRLTGQMSQRMPVLKPTIPPFYRRIAPEFTGLPLETDAVPSVSPFPREKTPHQAETDATASDQAKASAAFRPKSDLQPGKFLSPPPAQTVDLPDKPRIIEPGEPNALKDVVRESHANVNIRTSKNATADVGTQDFQPTRLRARRSRPQEQTEIIAGRTGIERHRQAASFSSAGKAIEPAEETPAAPSQMKGSLIQSLSPAIELHKPYKAKPARSEKSEQELQPRKNPMEKEALVVAGQFEPRVTPGPAATRRQQQESQAQDTSGVHIENLEVKIMPPAPPPAPVIRPQQARPAPATTLSRTFTSSLGLSQG